MENISLRNKTGDIVLIPFPFSELTNIKVRPAVIICETNDIFQDLVLCAVSSRIRNSYRSIILKPGIENNLKVESTIIVDRIFTLKQSQIIHHLGKLSEDELLRFRTVFKSLVD